MENKFKPFQVEFFEAKGFDKVIMYNGDYYYCKDINEHLCIISLDDGSGVYLYPYDDMVYKTFTEIEDLYFGLTGKHL